MLATIGRRSPAKLGAVGVAAAGAYAVTGYDEGVVTLWAQLEGNVAAFSVVIAALCVVVTALEWQLVWRHAAAHVPGRTIRDSRPLSEVWAVASAWLLAGWAVGVTGGIAAHGSPIVGPANPLVLVTAALVVPVSCGLGLLAGKVLPGVGGPLLAGVAVYIGSGTLVYGRSRWRVLAPIADGVPPLGSAFAARFLLVQAAWLLMLSAVLVAATITLTTRTRTLRTVALAAVSVATAGVLVTTDPVVAAPAPRACVDGPPAVCGPEAFASTFGALRDVSATFGEMTGVTVSRVDVATGSQAFRDGKLTVDTGAVQADPGLAAARGLLSPVGCDDPLAGEILAQGLVWISGAATRGVSPVGQAVGEALDGSTWLADNLDRVGSCDVRMDELPGIG